MFIAWFMSGLVLMYAGMPRLSPVERLARLPLLDFGAASVGPDALNSPQPPAGLRLAMVAGRPVYYVTSPQASVAVYADSGSRVAPVDEATAIAQARAFAPENGTTIRYDGRVTEPDQWTLEIARQLPLHRVALGDAADTRLYVSEHTGEILLETTASSRRWAYPGAILHWIYLTPIRRHTAGWAQFIIWTSLTGTVMAIAGLGWGVWRFSPRAVFRLKRTPRHSPYVGWMRWHHYAGLVFGVATVTWIFSGLLSMDPWDWHPSTTPTTAQQVAFSGGVFSLQGLSVDQLRHALRDMPAAKEASIVRSAGRRWLVTNSAATPLDEGTTTLPLDRQTVTVLARSAMPESRIADVAALPDYDAYYYDRGRELPLPVFRIRYDDPAETWLYVDGARGAVVRKEERLTRLNRWLYHGLHSLDFPWLYYRRPLWDVVVIVLSAGGMLLSVSTVAPACRRLWRLMRTLRS